MVAQSMMSKENESARETVITRVFDVPRELDRSKTSGAMVGAERVHDDDPRDGCAAGRRVAAHHAWPRWQRLS